MEEPEKEKMKEETSATWESLTFQQQHDAGMLFASIRRIKRALHDRRVAS